MHALLLLSLLPGLSTEKPVAGVPSCNGPNCAIHVFRVSLHNMTDRDPFVVRERLRTQSQPQPSPPPSSSNGGARFYVSSMNEEGGLAVTREVVDALPPLRELQKKLEAQPVLVERPRGENSRVDGGGGVNGDWRGGEWGVSLALLFVVLGAGLGVLSTCLFLVLLDYRNKPKFDRTHVVSYKKTREERPLVPPPPPPPQRAVLVHERYVALPRRHFDERRREPPPYSVAAREIRLDEQRERERRPPRPSRLERELASLSSRATSVDGDRSRGGRKISF